jgi:hypothetical protein
MPSEDAAAPPILDGLAQPVVGEFVVVGAQQLDVDVDTIEQGPETRFW